jgi:hypothetical protein
MTDKQRELKRERDRRYRKRKRLDKTAEEPDQDSELDSTRAEVRDIIRTEIRLRHRHQAAREMATVEAKTNRRLDDCSHLGGVAIRTYQDVEEFIGMSRRELFAMFGKDTGPQFVNYDGGE